jgi:large subunit ribosomal protein L30
MAKAKAVKKAGAKLRITQIRSGIGFDRKQSVVLRGLGLRRMRHTVEVPDTAGIRGMLHKVRHLVTVDSEKAGQ